jgi:glycosyltransferase involved in cell wall biosynthesis
VPYPPDYGGVFDLFFKLKCLYEAGVIIHLHCFEYGRGQQKELNQYCDSTEYYNRKSLFNGFSFRLPFIVSSRANRQLLNNLLKDDYPVLLEGIHCTYFLYTGQLKNKRVFVRLHNVENDYYNELAKAAYSPFKKIYFKWESFLLKNYERNIANKGTFVAVSEKDKRIYSEKFAALHVKFLPVFLPFCHVKSVPGTGGFCLYHGNLSVPENEKAAKWLIKNVFANIEIPVVIAGKNPSRGLADLARSNENICIIANPSASEMDDLISKAQLHVLPSFNKTGIKIKLLHALFNGRFVITNHAAVEETTIGSLCNLANTAEEFTALIKQLFYASFTESDLIERKKILENLYNNEANTKQLITWIW